MKLIFCHIFVQVFKFTDLIFLYMKKFLHFVFALMLCTGAIAQTPGLIVKPAQAPGNAVLDPNGDGYVSATNQGFSSNDVSESELPFTTFPGFEVPDDPIVGPSSSFNDFVVIGNEYGTSLYNDGTNLIFRMRLSRLLPNTKGYTVLIDTDNRFGQSGPNADPNWTAANRGFEIEILLTTNDLVRVYNIDGASTPGTPIASYSYNTHCQKSFALSFTNGYRDAFYDFYVPLSVLSSAPLNLNLNAPIRFVAITSMNPASVLTSNVSDVNGYPALRGDLWNTLEYMMEHTVAVSVNDVNNGIPQLKTEKPTITNFMQAGGTLVQGTSTEPAGTVIYIYRNGNLVDSTTVQNGGTWSLNLANTYNQGDAFVATALATNKTISDNGNTVIVAGAGCTAFATTFTVACLTRKGVSITPSAPISSGTITIFNTSGTQVFTLNVANALLDIPNTGDYFFPFNSSVTNCNSGPNVLSAGTYRIRFTQSGVCNSPDVWAGTNNNAVLPALSPTPVITSTSLFTTSSLITGTSTAAVGSTIYVYQNGVIIGSALVQTGGTWSMSPPPSTLVLNGNITARVQQAGLQLSAASNTVVVQQQTAVAPVVNGPLSVGNTLISGTSEEAPGSVVSVRINNVVVGTATVQADGTWSYTHNTPLTAGQQINATVSATGKIASAVGNTVTVLAQSPPPTFSSTIFETTTSLSGGMSQNVANGTIVYMIVDGAIVAQTTTNNNTWTITGFPIGELYAGAQVSFSAQVSGLNVSSLTGPFSVVCVNPDENISYTATFPTQVGQFLTVEVNNPEADIVYTLLDANTLQPISPSAYSIGNDFVLTSNVYSQSGTYEVVVQAIKAYEPSCNAVLADSMEFIVLPVTWLSITGERMHLGNLITWKVTDERNHSHYEVEVRTNTTDFAFIGKVSTPSIDGTIKTYRFVDAAKYANGTQFYRIKQVDLNGRYEYSNIVAINNNQTNRNTSMYPNPTRDILFVQIQAKNTEKVDLKIMDVTGKLIQSKQLNLTDLQLPFEINLSGMAQGTYFIQLQGADWSQTERIVKF